MAVRLIQPPDSLHLVGDSADPFRFVRINASDAQLADFGDPYAVPGVGVLHAATSRDGAYERALLPFRPAETSRGFRPVPGEHLMNVGSLPAGWRTRRRIISFALTDPLPFIDIESADTLEFLDTELRAALDDLEVPSLSREVLLGRDRRVPRLVARWAYSQIDSDEEASLGGIRRISPTTGNEWWEIFDGVDIGSDVRTPIRPEDADLMTVAYDFGITVH